MKVAHDNSVIVALDFETSGYYRHSACALGMIRIEKSLIVDEFYQVIRPPSDRICFTHIHGLTWEGLKDAPSFGQMWPRACEFMGGASFLMAHNARFDRSVLSACCSHFDAPQPALPFLCTLKGARKGLPIRRHGLADVCSYFHIGLTHHHAGSDARGCARIFLELMKLGLSFKDLLLG